MTIHRFLTELFFFFVVPAVMRACVTTPDGFGKLAAYLAGLAG